MKFLKKFWSSRRLLKIFFIKKIKTFQFDNGTECVNEKFSTLFSHNGIIHRFPCPHASQQNGIVERKHLANIIRSLLRQASRPPRFWANAPQIAVFLVNRTLSFTILKEKSPYEILHGCVPSDLQLVKLVGCLCFPNL